MSETLHDKKTRELQLKEKIRALGREVMDYQTRLSNRSLGSYKGHDEGKDTLKRNISCALEKSGLLKNELAKLHLEIDQEERAWSEEILSHRKLVKSDEISVLIQKVKNTDLRLTARVLAAEALISALFERKL